MKSYFYEEGFHMYTQTACSIALGPGLLFMTLLPMMPSVGITVAKV